MHPLGEGKGVFYLLLFFFLFPLSLPISGCSPAVCLSLGHVLFSFFCPLGQRAGGDLIKIGEPNRFSYSAMGWKNALSFSSFAAFSLTISNTTAILI